MEIANWRAFCPGLLLERAALIEVPKAPQGKDDDKQDPDVQGNRSGAAVLGLCCCAALTHQ
jgi:hypothetical protein